ncbi:MAG: nucleotidyltransferase substrate binding protein, partial [Rickettsiales bacterium]|nr:nucleotidyltransferase substrate binding protein [Rickettsiales bacterium]
MKKSRYLEFLDNFGKAVIELENAVSIYPEASKLEINGTIQVFEFTFELAWKTLKKYFELTKNEEVPFAVDAFIFAYKERLIPNQKI